MHRSVFVFMFCLLLPLSSAFAEEQTPATRPLMEGTSISSAAAETIFAAADIEEFDDIEIRIRMSSAPNVFGSPSWEMYTERALLSLMTDEGDIGDRNVDPTAYEVLNDGAEGLFDPGDIMVTSFNSWRGVADPEAPFDNELGNRLHCGLAAEGDGTIQFDLSDVIYTLASSDHLLDFSGTLEGTTLNGTTRVGLDYGPDRVPGTPDDIWYSNDEPDTTPLDALYYAGIGNAYWPGAGDPDAGQPAINAVRNYILAEALSLECAYYIRGNAALVEMNVDAFIFADGFESGDTSAWSAVVGE